MTQDCGKRAMGAVQVSDPTGGNNEITQALEEIQHKQSKCCALLFGTPFLCCLCCLPFYNRLYSLSSRKPLTQLCQ